MKRLVKTLAVLAGLSLFGVLAVIGMFFFISMDLPQINSLKDYNPPMNSRILSRDNEVLYQDGKETREVVPFEKIPKQVVDAFLAAEDDNFYHHQGVDYVGILRAFIVNLKEGRLVQGGSTITQQVAKSFLLSKERTISRKIKDLLLARKIEQKFTKEEILFLYLNQVYLGGGYYGVKAAFKGYFDKNLEEATPAECALVAGLLVAPGRYSPYVNPQYAKVRQNYVMKRMFETKKISEKEYQAALKEDIKMRIRNPNDMKGGHFTDWIRQEVMKSVGIDEFLTNGFTVVTTLDWALQEKAEKAVKVRVKELDKRQGFKGPIRHLVEDAEIQQFIAEQRKKILKEQSSFFTFVTSGKNIYEFHEDDDALSKNLSYFEEEKSKLNERFKSIVDIGNSDQDPFNSFLKIGSTYSGVVLDADDLKKTILVEIAGTRVVVPQSGYEWAHERKFGENPVWHQPITNPSKILKRGDVVLVSISNKAVTLDKMISEAFYKKFKDPELKKIIAKQSFFQGALDQEPEAEGALIALNANNGEIVTLVGGVDFRKSQFNRALQSARQPGSAFKPFIYAAGLENGFTPSTILMDTPQALGGVDDSLSWKPRNYDGDFKGPMTYRNALEVSRNIPAVRLVQELGVAKILNFAKRFHLNADLPKDMSLSLGSFGMSLAELTKGYAIFPNGGRAVRLHHITSIKDRNGKSYTIPAADAEWPASTEKIPEPKVEAPPVEGAETVAAVPASGNPFLSNLNSTQVYDTRLAYIMTNLLNGVVRHGTGAGAAKVSINLGGKTGTTNSFVDALFVGFSSHLVVGSWVGFDDNRSIGYGETGTKAALPMWTDYVEATLTKFEATDFRVPAGIVNVLINKQTGKPLPEGSTDGFLEAYVEGYGPGSTPQTFDQSGQPTNSATPAMEDDDYFINQ